MNKAFRLIFVTTAALVSCTAAFAQAHVLENVGDRLTPRGGINLDIGLGISFFTDKAGNTGTIYTASRLRLPNGGIITQLGAIQGVPIGECMKGCTLDIYRVIVAADANLDKGTNHVRTEATKIQIGNEYVVAKKGTSLSYGELEKRFSELRKQADETQPSDKRKKGPRDPNIPNRPYEVIGDPSTGQVIRFYLDDPDVEDFINVVAFSDHFSASKDRKHAGPVQYKTQDAWFDVVKGIQLAPFHPMADETSADDLYWSTKYFVGFMLSNEQVPAPGVIANWYPNPVIMTRFGQRTLGTSMGANQQSSFQHQTDDGNGAAQANVGSGAIDTQKLLENMGLGGKDDDSGKKGADGEKLYCPYKLDVTVCKDGSRNLCIHAADDLQGEIEVRYVVEDNEFFYYRAPGSQQVEKRQCMKFTLTAGKTSMVLAGIDDYTTLRVLVHFKDRDGVEKDERAQFPQRGN